MSTPAHVVVYGAYGHTGRFIVEELLAKGVTPVLAGRDARRLEAYRPAGQLERCVATIDSASDLERAFADAGVVINAAGPYLDTGLPVARAAIAAGAHYLDLSAEQAAVRAIHLHLDGAAKAAGVTLVPAMAFYGCFADLLAARALSGRTRADRVDVAVWLDRWWPTEGTRITGERNTVPRQVLRAGQLSDLGEPPTSRWTFADPVGEQAMVEVPFSEVMTIARHLEVTELRSHLATGALSDVRDASTPGARGQRRARAIAPALRHGGGGGHPWSDATRGRLGAGHLRRERAAHRRGDDPAARGPRPG